ncbi:MAG TPA: hypothetical protein VJL87_05315 [Bdellovibrionota bacterium]|nr:hypothetical protein [Bdellovibrionota bacterium]
MGIAQVSPKQQIFKMVQPITISDAQFNACNEKIQQKLAERVFPASEAMWQPKLDQISELYKKTIEEYKANLQRQYDLGKKVLQQIKETDDLQGIVLKLEVFRIEIMPLLDIHKKKEVTISLLEGQIVSLLPKDTQLVV